MASPKNGVTLSPTNPSVIASSAWASGAVDGAAIGSDATITGTINHSIVIGTTGSYASPLTIAATGYVSNNGSGYAISYNGYAPISITNFGRISATGGHDAVRFDRTNATISNYGTISVSGSVSA